MPCWKARITSRRQYLGMLRGFPCYVTEVSDKSPPAGMAFEGVRSLYGLLEDDFFRIALTAVHLVEWDRTRRFCGRCGAPTESSREERAKKCVKCGSLVFPRISPAVIVLVERDNRVLLARAARFPDGLYSVLAGFAEPGVRSRTGWRTGAKFQRRQLRLSRSASFRVCRRQSGRPYSIRAARRVSGRAGITTMAGRWRCMRFLCGSGSTRIAHCPLPIAKW